MGNDRNRRANTQQPTGARNGARRVHFSRREVTGDHGELAEINGLGQILDWLIKSGDAIMVSTTSDGGAIVVTVLSGDAREKAYAVGQMELQGVFDQVATVYKPE